MPLSPVKRMIARPSIVTGTTSRKNIKLQRMVDLGINNIRKRNESNSIYY